jgi:hypothetical protein
VAPWRPSGWGKPNWSLARGPFLLLAFILALFPLPAVVGPLLARNGPVLGEALALWKWNPPFAAAAVMAGAPAFPLAGWLLPLVGYCAALAAAVAALDRLPFASRTVAHANPRITSPRCLVRNSVR